MSGSIIENLVKQFLYYPDENNAYKLIRTLRCSNFHNMTILVGKYLSNIYPHNIDIRSESAISAYYASKYKISYDLYSKNLHSKNLDENASYLLKFNRHFSSSHISDHYIKYPSRLITKIMKKVTNRLPIVTFTITTCKRYDLFEQTINSFLNCCKDLKKIDSWVCVDDNSSEEDRKKMEENYPFFTFYWKKIEDKGHPRSMNIIRNIVNTPYIFHMEDDWKFIEKRNYISECMEVLGSNDKIGQCLINKNYGETIDDIHTSGGLFNKTQSGLRFFIHEYTPDEKSRIEFNLKYKDRKNCSYWPHFSFRPSMLKKNVLDIIGPYNEKVSHFEMDYSTRYIKLGFVSAFLESIYCLHIGRLTSQRDDKRITNAYDLNNELQFSGKEEIKISDVILKRQLSNDKIKIYLINLDRRVDRLNAFDTISPIKYTRFSGIDGNLLKPNKQLQKIFEGNNYNMRAGLVGCAMSHIKLFIDLINSGDDTESFLIMEDDVTFVPNFTEKIEHVITKLKDLDWDFIYLGHHLYPNHKTDDSYDKNVNIILEKWSSNLSLIKSMGGFFSYLINKKGAKKLLDFINTTGMTNAIDTVQQKAICKATMNTFYCYPHLIYSQCVLYNNQVNSDIQYNFKSASLVKEDLEDIYHSDDLTDRLKIEGEFNITNALIYSD